MVLYVAGLKELPVHEYTPLEVKATVAGFGRADKKQVAEMVKRTVFLEKKRRRDDEYDAIAVALACLYRDGTRYPHQ